MTDLVMSVIVITAPLWSPDSPSIWPPRYDWPTPLRPLYLQLYMAVAVITGAVPAGAATIRYPVKQPYSLSKIKTLLHFTITLLNLKFPHVPFLIANYQARPWYVYRLSQDWYLRYWQSFVFSSHTHFAIIHRHIFHTNFYIIWLVSLWISSHYFVFRQNKSPPYHTVIRIHLISLSYHILFILPSHFSSMEQMLMLMLYP